MKFPIIVERKWPTWNGFAMFGELQWLKCVLILLSDQWLKINYILNTHGELNLPIT